MKRAYKRIIFGILAGISLAVSLAGVLPSTVLAANETYTWKDFNTIIVSGGDIKGSVELKLIRDSNPERLAATSAVEHNSGCDLRLSIALTGNTSGKLTSPLPGPGGGSRPTGAVYCSDMHEVCSGIWPFRSCRVEPRFPDVSAGYNDQTVNIQGTRPSSGNQSETDLQKGVSVTINAPNPANGSPDTITIEIKDAAGNLVDSATPGQEAALGSDDPNSPTFIEPDQRPVRYFNTFTLEPGKYTVCASIVIKDCKPFEKKKFESLMLEYGDTSNERLVIAKLTVEYTGGPQNMTVGPLEVTLRKPDGSLITVRTDTREHRMTNDEEQANGLITVTYTFGLESRFKDMDPATYEICVVGLADCKEVVKQAGENAIVEFRIDWNDFSEDNSEDRECKDKYVILGNEGTTYLVCSVIDTSTFAVGQLDGAISSLLTIDVKDIFDDKGGNNAYHTAWNSFRFFALGLLVIAALIMVVSQAAGLEIVDAYTIRKILPRLLFATVAISLSWDFMEFLVQLSNDAGNGVRALMYAPFKDIANVGGSIGGGSILALTLISTGAALSFGFIGLLSFVVTGLLASLVAIAVLIFRKMLILLLVMMAPFAIAAYVLPNTQKLWDTWKTSFISVLVVFPIIMGFIAIGRIMSVVAFNSPGSATVNQLVAIVAYFAPYFLITLAFRMAGGLIGTVGGVVNDRSRGAFDRLKKFRGNKTSENMNRMATGRRFQGSNPLARAFNTTTFGATTFAKSRSKMGFLTDKNVRQSTFEQQRSLNAMKYARTPAGRVAAENEYILRTQRYANEADARAHLIDDWDMYEKNEDGTYKLDNNGDRIAQTEDMEHMIASTKANGGWSRDAQLNAAKQLFHTGTGYDNLRQAMETIRDVAAGNRDIAAAIAGDGNGVTGQVDRLDLKIGYNEYMKVYDEMAAAPDGEVSEARLAQATMKAIEGNDAVSMARGRKMVLENVMPVLSEALEAARITARDNNAGVDEQGRSRQQLARDESGRLTGILEQYMNSGAYSSPQNIQNITQRAVEPTAQLRDEVEQEASGTVLVRDPTTGNLVQSIQTDPITGAQIAQPNLGQQPRTARGLNEQRPRRRGQ